jgi:hypothetical protein
MSRAVQVFARNVYGTFKNYPANQEAEQFAQLLRVKTFSIAQLESIKQLGFAIEYVSDPEAHKSMPRAQFEAIMDAAEVSHKAELARAEWERS